MNINKQFGQSANTLGMHKENSIAAEKETTSKREVLSSRVNKLKSLFSSKSEIDKQ